MAVARRDILKATLVGSMGSLTGVNVKAQNASDDYKALVCVFLFGGMDCHDLLIPYGTSAYADYASVREELLTGYQGSRERSALAPLTGSGTASTPTFAFTPDLAGLQSLFNQSSSPLAVVGNVGPLVEPTTQAQLQDRSVRLPPRLFSHNDQQSVWQASQPEGAQYGWGGLFADAVLARNSETTFTTITGGGAEVFLTGRASSPYQVSLDGRTALELKEIIEEETTGSLQSFDELIATQSTQSDHILVRDLASAFRSGFSANKAFASAIKSAPTSAVSFPMTGLGRQLEMVARAISVNGQMGVSRQIFLVGMGGFDTHSGQASWLPNLLRGMNDAFVAFNDRLAEFGYSDKVTLFTASDFGRTLSVNGDGTDHGWGGHHLVMGGAVNGGDIYGEVPPSVLGNERDAGQGRLIPTISVEEYAASLGRWFGLSTEELRAALPNLTNFSDTTLSSLLKPS